MEKVMNITANKIKREIRKAKKAIARYSEKLGQHGFSYNDKKPKEGHAAYAWVRAIDAEYEKVYKLEGMLPVEQRTASRFVKTRPSRRRFTKSHADGFYDSREWRELRYRALAVNNGKCECCGAGKHEGAQLHVDHIKPRSLNPELELEITNLQVLCKECNLGKSNKDDTDWRLSQKKLEYSDLYCAANALILHKPSVVESIDGVSLCEISHIGDEPSGRLLFEIIYAIRERPGMTQAMILGMWYGTKEGAILSRLAGMDRLINYDDMDRQFVDIITLIRKMPLNKKLSEQVEKIKDMSIRGVSEEEIAEFGKTLAETLEVKIGISEITEVALPLLRTIPEGQARIAAFKELAVRAGISAPTVEV